MFGIKFQSLKPAVFTFFVISIVYLFSVIKLLQPHNEDISLTKKEISGLDDYRLAAALYFELHHTKQAKEVANKLQNIESYQNKKSWLQAKNSLTDDISFSDILNVLNHLIRDIGDESHLILDAELPVYYSIDLLFNNIPLLTKSISDTNIQPFISLDNFSKDKLYHALKIIHNTGCDPCLRLKPLVENISKSLQNSNSKSQEIEKISILGGQVLNEFLQQRLHKQTRHRYIILTIIFLLYAISLRLVVFSLQNYVSKREVDLTTERKHLIEELAKKNDELEKFAYAAAHDLKEPVRTMRCFAQLLKTEATPNLANSSLEYIDIIENTAQRSIEMINDLLSYTKINEQALIFENCDCNKELQSVLQDLKSSITESAAKIISENLPTISTVPSMLRRVLLNLLDNAIKYRRQDTDLIIKISAQKHENHWLFTVEDNGSGVSSQYREQVFEPFRRLNESSKEGIGIGLTSCRRIIERLGGQIWITDSNKNGTIVQFSIGLIPA